MVSSELHAFISYAHLDNLPLQAGEPGWVTRFHAALEVLLAQRLGEQSRIWRDPKLAGNDEFGNEIVDRFGKAALLVSILTPRYLRSDWCLKELQGFAEAAATSGGVLVGNKNRVFKVMKTPLAPDTALPPVVTGTLGYPFFTEDGKGSHELDPVFGAAAREEFLRRVSQLAVEMEASLRAMAAPGRATGLPVFLAACGRDMQSVRAQLAADLLTHGHEVLPAQALPDTEDALRAAVDAQLERAVLAIHLVGAGAGPVPDGPTGRALVALQNDLAAARSSAGDLKRIIWLPDGTVGERPEHQAFLDSLLGQASAQAGADLLRGDVEALKGAMHAALRALAAPPPAAPVAASARTPTVHLLLTEADRSAAVPLIKALRARQLAVTIPVFTGAAAEMRDANAQLIAACDALLLLYAAGDEAWKFHQLNDLRKQAATGKAAPPQWVVLAPPRSADKELLQALGEPQLIDLLDGLDDAALEPLVSALATAAGRR